MSTLRPDEVTKVDDYEYHVTRKEHFPTRKKLSSDMTCWTCWTISRLLHRIAR